MDGDGARYGIADALDRGRDDVVDDAKRLLPFRVQMLCCCLRDTIAIVIVIVGLRSGCCRCGVPVVLERKDVLAMFLIVDVSTLLLLLTNLNCV